jgi:hypothetical protein
LNAYTRPRKTDWLKVALSLSPAPSPPRPRTWHPPYMPHELDLHPDVRRIEATIEARLDDAERGHEAALDEAKGATSKVQDHLDCALFALEEISRCEVPKLKAEMKELLEKIIEQAKTAIG